MGTLPHIVGAAPALRPTRAGNAPRRLAAFLVVALTPLGVVAQPAPTWMQELSVEQLKALYLACDRASVERRLGAAEVALCSVAYEDLKRRAFDGDFEKLLAWSRRTPSRPVAGR